MQTYKSLEETPTECRTTKYSTVERQQNEAVFVHSCLSWRLLWYIDHLAVEQNRFQNGCPCLCLSRPLRGSCLNNQKSIAVDG